MKLALNEEIPLHVVRTYTIQPKAIGREEFYRGTPFESLPESRSAPTAARPNPTSNR